ncbi:hypothetical protein [Cohnella laeviribosi]|uniref:hypothetical protein n=1 Tax=Cohnella laeviribosi TaxID=380174 RepID=UPI00037360A5|nr:hypothetical protein [Cohnella laeviribosi]
MRSDSFTLPFPDRERGRLRVIVAEQRSDHLLKQLLPHARTLDHVVITDPDHDPVVIDQMHLANPLIAKFFSRQAAIVRAVAVHFDRDADAGANIREIQVAASLQKIGYLVFGMQMPKMPERRPPNMLEHRLFRMGVADFQSAQRLALPPGQVPFQPLGMFEFEPCRHVLHPP